MHCSVWRFRGDPDELERAYTELIERIRRRTTSSMPRRGRRTAC